MSRIRIACQTYTWEMLGAAWQGQVTDLLDGIAQAGYAGIETTNTMIRLDPQYVSFGPDTGHIVRGGQDLLTCLRTHLPRITHLHFKDVTATGEWVGPGGRNLRLPGGAGTAERGGL